MAFKLSVAARNARLNALETVVGPTPKLHIMDGVLPASCADDATGTIIAKLTLPEDFMGDASAGTKSLLGVWEGTASAAGTARYFRIYDTSEAVCHVQGSVTIKGAGGDLEFDNPVIEPTQGLRVSTFTLSDGNA